MTADVEPGPVARAVEADLADLGELRGGGMRTFAAMARHAARVLDARGDEEGVTATARLMEVLRSTMTALTSRDTRDPNELATLTDALSTPSRDGDAVPAALRYPKKPRSGNARAGSGQDSRDSG